ncbi:uncharacterized protein FMAN_13863 [Fusarium mangiferae]|uniref:Uncharacterized protein n=1 Tax=Fusarium mangiferae TaxID=192010 RepID=A0A1L7TL10_FUSMA|nr:uncharacterized protein FMAN_13863 [Fusarium mangiferae]CVK95941.1 uncharacterized protein FMAN_13863 [Fusarium mangiferae]
MNPLGALDYAVQWFLYAGLYGYQDYYPLLTALRHVRSLKPSTSEDGTAGILGRTKNTSFWSTIYPTKGLGTWLVGVAAESALESYLQKFLPPFLTKCFTTIITAPLKFLWIRSIMSEHPILLSSNIRLLRCVTAKQWFHFIGTLLACNVVVEIPDLVCKLGLLLLLARGVDVVEEWSKKNTTTLGMMTLSVFFTLQIIHAVISVPHTVAGVEAAPDIDEAGEGRSTRELLVDIKTSLKSMNFSLWFRFGVYHCITFVMARIASAAGALGDMEVSISWKDPL